MPVGTTGVLHCRFYKRDLIPVKHIIYAANREEIRVDGAIFLRLTGKRATGFLRRTAAVLVYISQSTNRFYLSREALIQLDVILPDFPRVGAATDLLLAPLDCHSFAHLGTMEKWILKLFASSTFNQCTHQSLPGITGPVLALHVDTDAVPSAVHT